MHKTNNGGGCKENNYWKPVGGIKIIDKFI